MSHHEHSGTGRPTLVLVPTRGERERLAAAMSRGAGLGLVELVGVGPVAAAARTAELLARLTPRRVLLVGIAGSLDPRALSIGDASAFDALDVDGIGAGLGSSR